jgi:hypothetical protein
MKMHLLGGNACMRLLAHEQLDRKQFEELLQK